MVGYEPGWDVCIGVDSGASQLRQDGVYYLVHEEARLYSHGLMACDDDLTDRYPVLLPVDRIADDDRDRRREPTAQLGRRLVRVANDLLVTSGA